MLLLSDIHWDPLYVVGTWAECNMQQVCCRAEVGEPAPNASLSGKYGGWECDTPWSTIENLFEHLAKEHSVSQNNKITGISSNKLTFFRTSITLYGLEI